MRIEWPPLILGGVLAGVYAATLAPGYTWANRAADAGDLITAAYTGGVPHPPGYPTYILLARLFQFLPFGTLAFRTNLLSAVCALLAALVLMDLTRRVCLADERVSRWAGFIAGLGFGLSPLFWSQAVITEVYALHVLFVALILWLMFVPIGEVRLFNKVGLLDAASWRERLIGLLLGLALGNQVTVILLLPVWLFLGEAQSDSGKTTVCFQVDGKTLARRVTWLMIGLLVYVVIPLRARGGSPVNWGHAVDWEGFWWLVSGQLYQGKLFNFSPDYFLPRLRNWAGMLRDQFGVFGMALGFFGLLYGQARRVVVGVTLWVAIAFSLFSITYTTEDYYVLMLPLYLVFALWLGMGAARLLMLMSSATTYARWAFPLSVGLFLVLIGLNASRNYAEVDASRNRQAVDFAQSVLSRVPQDGLLMTVQDEDTFVLWYYHYALGHRPDLIVLHEGLLAYAWYRQVMQAYYPELKLPVDWECFPCAIKEVLRLNRRPYCQIQADGAPALLCW